MSFLEGKGMMDNVEESMKEEGEEYKEVLKEQIQKTKEIVTILERSAKQFNALWYMAAYMAIILSLILVKYIWW